MDQTSFIILARSRTGSNMLLSMLRSHPQIHARGEFLGRLDDADLDERLETAFRAPPQIRAVGFKAFYYHPVGSDSEALWRRLTMMEDLRVIHLKRRNILRTLVSREIADRTGVWAEQESRGRPTAKKQISLSPSALRRGFEQTRRWERDFDRRFAQHALLTIFYEDLVEDPVATFRDVTRFLGIDMREPEIATQRQNPEPLHQLITNLEDLQDEFADSEWAEFFHE